MPTRLRLMADYRCWPLWGDGGENIDPSRLPLSPELRRRLHAWATTYDRTLNDEDPPESGFANEDQALAFEQEGRQLWADLRRELGAGFEIRYFSNRHRRLLDSPS